MKKIIVPTIITIIFILYFIIYFGFIISLLDGFLKIALAVIPAGFTAVMIYVLVERIKEIRSGEEDDISKY